MVGLVVGLALGNHLTVALLLPLWLLAAAGWGTERRVDRLAWSVAGLLGGLLVYAYLPWRAATQPIINWGNPANLAGFWWLVSGQLYRELAFGLPADLWLDRLGGWAGIVTRQVGWIGMAAAFAGLILGEARGWRVKAALAWLLLAYSIFAIGYNTADSYAYLLPVSLALAIGLGLGLATALEALTGRQQRLRRPWRASLRLVLSCGLATVLLVNAVRNLPSVDASQANQAEVFGQAVLAQAPPDALVMAHADREAFALWYFHFAQGMRPDIVVIVQPLLAYDWYRDSLRSAYPRLIMPAAPQVDWRMALIEAYPGPVCDADADGNPALVCQP